MAKAPLYVGQTYFSRRWYYNCRRCHCPSVKSWPTREEALAAAMEHCREGS